MKSPRSRSRSRSRPHAANDEMRTHQPSDSAQGWVRRASINGQGPNVNVRLGNDRPGTPLLHKETAGMLHMAGMTPTQNRVSFLRRQDGSMNNSMYRFDIDSSPKESNITTNTCRSLRESMNWPPPPPSRSSALNQVGNEGIALPFPVNPVASKVKIRSVRRRSMIELEQLDEIRVHDPPPAIAIRPTQPFQFEQRRRSDGDEVQARQVRHSMYSDARQDYWLGDLAKCPSHMVIEDCPRSALSEVSQLKLHDFAFIKRSDDSWTYAVLAHRHKGETEDGEYMKFVMNEAGATKIIKKKQWADFVRCVAAEDLSEEPSGPSVPKNISIDRNMDDCSMISFTSFYGK